MRVSLVVAGLVILPGCDEPAAGQGQALKAALAAAEQAALDTRIEATTAAEPSVWHRLIRRDFARHGNRLGNLRLTVESGQTLRPGTGEALTLREKRTSELALNGDFALHHELSWQTPDDTGEDARRCWRLDGQPYVGHRAGPATRFTEHGGESDHCLVGAVEPVQAWLQVFEPRSRVVAEPGEPFLGRPTVRVTVAEDPNGGAVAQALPTFWQENPGGTATEETMGVPGPRGWLVTTHATLKRLSGELVLDAETGLPLTARLEARLAVQKADQAAELEVRVALATESRSGPVSRPSEIVEAGPRPRVFRERVALLGEKPAEPSAAPLPKPGDAPPLAVAPGAEGEPAIPANPSESR